jgi:hypothetical protein
VGVQWLLPVPFNGWASLPVSYNEKRHSSAITASKRVLLALCALVEGQRDTAAPLLATARADIQAEFTRGLAEGNAGEGARPPLIPGRPGDACRGKQLAGFPGNRRFSSRDLLRILRQAGMPVQAADKPIGFHFYSIFRRNGFRNSLTFSGRISLNSPNFGD